MTVEELNREIARINDEVRAFARDGAPVIVGVEAVNYFQKAFDDQGWEGKSWDDVERRKPDSAWYGHSGQTGRFSEARTTAPILSGETGELRNAIKSDPQAGKVTIRNEKPYARVHNEGLPAKIYGRKSFVMKKRTFMAVTDGLMKNIHEKLQREVDKIVAGRR